VAGNETLADAITRACGEHFSIVGPEVADVVWIAHDTPVEDAVPDTDAVLARVRALMASVPAGAIVVLSSQLPVGTFALLESEFPEHRWAVSPENVRSATAYEDFVDQPRIVVGTRRSDHHPTLERLLSPFTSRIVWMAPESAEMTKHAINAWLATSVCFINEIAAVCMTVGADPMEVSTGLKSDPRIGERAYLRPGAPYGHEHLGRDVTVLNGLGPGPLLRSIPESNARPR